MAKVTSGSVSTNSITGYGLTTSFILSWSATQSITDNTSTISWELKTVQSPTGSGYQRTIYNAYVTIDGKTYNLGSQTSVSHNTVLMSSSSYGTKVITHNADGSKSFDISIGVSVGQSSTNCSGSDSFELTTIPRYTSISSFTVAKRNETSLTFNWQTADTIDYLWYSTDNGSTCTGYDVTDGKSGSFNVGSLTPNTTYNCKIKVRRKDSQLNTESSRVSQTTYKVPSQSLKSKTETSITMNWSVDSTANHIWYSKDNGANWVDVGDVNATSGSYTISGLSANTSYDIKTRVRRSVTNTTYDTSVSSQTTYAYPYCTEAPNFTIGNNVTIKLYNPLNRTVKIQMWSYTSRGFISDKITTNGTSYTGFGNFASSQYKSIPNNTESKFTIDVWYGDNKATKWEAGTYSIKGTEVPSFSDFTYKDSNTNVTNVTGNNQIMVKGLSTVQVTVSSANKMVAQNSATAKNYGMSMSTLSATVDYSTSDIIKELGTINASGTQRLNVIAYDSRGLSKTVYKDITVYNYAKPVINATITRLNNFENETTIKVNGTYTRLTINNSDKNTIAKVQYRYRETGGTWSSWINITTTINSGKFTCSNVVLSLDNTKSFEFQIQAIDTLQQTTTTTINVDIGQAIFFVSTNNRTCYINNKEVLTNDYNGNVDITGVVDVIGTLQVNGQDVIMYDVVDTW